ncbi:MAG TPA: proline dehydrogenase family protein [Ktedonobacteraceae bacterium]|nr:proline dehydrogenase family protein [Ktedonobacteraceae bacterium]
MLKGTLLYLAHNPGVRDFVIHNKATRGVSRRFVAGEKLDEAIATARALNGRGLHVSLDHLGENVSDAKEARAAAQDYIAILDAIKQSGVDANISIKLTALGLDIAEEMCEENVRLILERARQFPIFVRIDMEGSAYTEQTVDMTLRLHKQFEHVGTVIQAMLYRSRKDIERLITQGVRVRLVKGAYQEQKTVAYQNKSEVDHNYIELMKLLLLHGNYPAIATHDEVMINATRRFARDNGVSKAAFEFQMLYGIRRDLQEQLVKEGYNVRVYVPYGSQWYPYLMRRMAERPANLIFVMSNALR